MSPENEQLFRDHKEFARVGRLLLSYREPLSNPMANGGGGNYSQHTVAKRVVNIKLSGLMGNGAVTGGKCDFVQFVLNYSWSLL